MHAKKNLMWERINNTISNIYYAKINLKNSKLLKIIQIEIIFVVLNSEKSVKNIEIC